MRIIRCTVSLSFVVLLLSLVGCGAIRVPLGTSLAPADTSIAGNWQFTVTPANGAAPFSELSGAVDTVPDGDHGGGVGITSVLLAPSNDCFAGTTGVPFHGLLTGAALQLTSFSVNGQQAALSANLSPAGDQLNGTYTISGGCADHAAGSLDGVRYETLQGSFNSTSTSSLQGLTLQVQQAIADSGDGTFAVSGMAELANSPCFTQGALLPTGGAISGKHVKLVFALKGSVGGAQLTLNGDVNPSADKLTFQQAAISGGPCAGDLGVVQLSKVN